LVPAQAGS